MPSTPVNGLPRYLASSVALFEAVDDSLLPLRAIGIQASFFAATRLPYLVKVKESYTQTNVRLTRQLLASWSCWPGVVHANLAQAKATRHRRGDPNRSWAHGCPFLRS